MLQDASRYASHFLHPYQLPTAELHHDAMKPGSPTKLTHLLTFGIAVNLLHRGHSQVIGINAQEIPLTEHGYEGNKAPWHN